MSMITKRKATAAVTAMLRRMTAAPAMSITAMNTITVPAAATTMSMGMRAAAATSMSMAAAVRADMITAMTMQ